MIKPGSRLAHYEILSSLGTGGMGQVWLARDEKLGREVAIKTLPPEFTNDRQRLSRFEREARSLAALNHVNVASIHGIEDDSGQSFLVLEHVDGLTLEERIARGPVPQTEALDIALQVAQALEAAHDRGIIHRDLKPANIKISQDGTVKVLDFGLAKPFDAPGQGNPDATTLTRATEHGALIGTPAYMSPEQVRGEELDTRSDIWAFGVILHEMLTGQCLFQAGTIPDMLARVLAPGTPDLDLPANISPLIARLIRRCLAKRREDRLRHIGDARIELRDMLDDAPFSDAHAESAAPSAPVTVAHWSRWGIVVASIVVLGAAAWIWASQRQEPLRLEHYSITTEQPVWEFLRQPAVSISPGGTKIAYVSFGDVYIYSTDDGTTRSESRTGHPFFSHDGARLGIVGGEVSYVPVDGGNLTRLADVPARSLGGSWGSDGRMVYASNEGLFRTTAPGEGAEPLIVPDPALGQLYFGWPEILPGDRTVVFTVLFEDPETRPQLALLDLDTLKYEILPVTGSGAKYVPTGHLLTADRGRLIAVEFDLETLRIGSERIDLGYEMTRSAPSFDISKSDILDILVYVPPPSSPIITNFWVDSATGIETPADMTQGYRYARLSPDGTKVVGDRVVDNNRDLYIWDFEREIETQLTTSPREDLFGLWSPDGETIYFSGDGPREVKQIFSVPANLSRPPRVHYANPGVNVWAISMSPEHGVIALDGNDIVSIGLNEPAEVTTLLSLGAVNLNNPDASPDGNFLAYQSDETGQTEVYVRSIGTAPYAYFKVSAAGGSHPIWSRDGETLFYVDFDGMMQAVAVDYEPEFSLGEMTEVFQTGYGPVSDGIRPPSGRNFDAARQGRFLSTEFIAPAPTMRINLVRNWTEALR